MITPAHLATLSSGTCATHMGYYSITGLNKGASGHSARLYQRPAPPLAGADVATAPLGVGQGRAALAWGRGRSPSSPWPPLGSGGRAAPPRSLNAGAGLARATPPLPTALTRMRRASAAARKAASAGEQGEKNGRACAYSGGDRALGRRWGPSGAPPAGGGGAGAVPGSYPRWLPPSLPPWPPLTVAMAAQRRARPRGRPAHAPRRGAVQPSPPPQRRFRPAGRARPGEPAPPPGTDLRIPPPAQLELTAGMTAMPLPRDLPWPRHPPSGWGERNRAPCKLGRGRHQGVVAAHRLTLLDVYVYVHAPAYRCSAKQASHDMCVLVYTHAHMHNLRPVQW